MKTRTLMLIALIGFGGVGLVLVAPMILLLVVAGKDRCETYAEWMGQDQRAQRITRWADAALLSQTFSTEDVVRGSDKFGQKWRLKNLRFEEADFSWPLFQGDGAIGLIDAQANSGGIDDNGVVLWVSTRMAIAVMKPDVRHYSSTNWQDQYEAVSDRVSVFCVVD